MGGLLKGGILADGAAQARCKEVMSDGQICVQ